MKAFDADGPEGKFQRVFVKKEAKSAIKGPMGLIFNSDGDLLLSNQNVDTEKPGEINKHDGATGAFLGPLVSKSDENAPFAPRGIVLLKNNENDENDDVLFVASLNVKRGRMLRPADYLAYTEDGGVSRRPDPRSQKRSFRALGPTGEFHPRGVVIGPDDGLLYRFCLSMTSDTKERRLQRVHAVGRAGFCALTLISWITAPLLTSSPATQPGLAVPNRAGSGLW